MTKKQQLNGFGGIVAFILIERGHGHGNTKVLIDHGRDEVLVRVSCGPSSHEFVIKYHEFMSFSSSRLVTHVEQLHAASVREVVAMQLNVTKSL